MATPALRALRRAHPGAEITLEGRPFLEGLVRGLPSVDVFLPDRGLAVLERARATWVALAVTPTSFPTVVSWARSQKVEAPERRALQATPERLVAAPADPVQAIPLNAQWVAASA
jgi:hypothetical protein